MMFLKKESVPLSNGGAIEIQQLSGLDRFESQKYIFSLEKPTEPEEPAEGASKAEEDAYQEAMFAWLGSCDHWRFNIESQRVAMALINHDEFQCKSLEERHKLVGSMFSIEDISTLNVAVLKLSGMYVDPESHKQDSDQAEPVDPKS